jgi:hypothetical protein
MKCALELKAISTIKKEEIEKKKELERMAKKAEIIANSILLCEDIGKDLELRAEEGKDPVYSFLMYNNHRVNYTCALYANGEPSYYEIGKEFDLKVMADWFAKYCFKISTEPQSLKRYGIGTIRGYLVTIEPDPACF